MLRDFFFRPPVFANPEKTRRAATLFALIWINTIAGALTLVGAMLTQLEIAPVAITNLFVLGFMAILLLALGHRGRINTAGWFLIGIDILSTSLRALHAGGIRAPGVTLFFIYPLMAGLLLGETAGVVTAAVCGAIGLGLVLAEQHNILPDQTRFYNIFTYWWIGCFYMSLVIYLMRLATQNVNRALKRAEAELTDRRKTEQHLSIALEAGAIGIWDGDLRSTRFRADERTSAIMDLPRAADGTIAFEAWRAIIPTICRPSPMAYSR
jgi:PAS domain-containing protein